MKELVLIGGRPAEDSEIHRYLAERAKNDRKIGYVPFAPDDPSPHIAKMESVYATYGVKVRVIRSVDDCYGLSVIYLGGGDQNKLLLELEQTGIAELLRPQWKKGNVLLAGSSAGAMVLFWDMLPDGENNESTSLELIKGMGPMGGGLVASHANLISAGYKKRLALAHPALCIICIDENTALRWRNGVCDVLGSGTVELMGRSKGSWRSGEEFDLSATKE